MNAPSQDIQVESLKVPPHSIEAEQSVLGGLLLDNSAWDRIADFLQESAFYRYDHRLIFQHIGKLIAASRPADVITVFESLSSSGKPARRGIWPTSMRLRNTRPARPISAAMQRLFGTARYCANSSPSRMRLRATH